MKADLQVHTKNSDGLDTIPVIKEKIRNISSEKKVIGIVDHHHVTLTSLQEDENFILVPGVEVSCDTDDVPCHLLGYTTSFNPSSNLQKIFKTVNDGYNTRARKIYNKLTDLGYTLPPLESLRDPAVPQVISLNDLGEALAKALDMDSTIEAKKWAKANGNLLFAEEEKFLPSAEYAIKSMKDSGLTVVWAHPGRRLRLDEAEQREKFQAYLKQLIQFGLDGIEVFYPAHSTENIKFLLDIAERKNLLVTGGSDYHGLGRGPELPILSLDESHTKIFLNKIGYN